MGSKISIRLWYYLPIVICCFFLSACSAAAQSPSIPTPPGAQAVDPVFREFHRALGGIPVLGYAISPLMIKGDAQCQYTQKALMCYNPLLPENERSYLYPLGRELGQSDLPQPVTSSGQERVINGYVIFDDFTQVYDRLFGEKFVGRPLTQVRLNETQNRYEQYFENVGFFRRKDAPRGQVELIEYGASHCGLACAYHPSQANAVIGGYTAAAQVFINRINRIGGVRVYGQPLTEPYILPDGGIEQVYEKAVFYAPAGDMRKLTLRPVPLILGIAFSLPAQRVNDSRMVFYKMDGDLGFNVPVIFDQFIAGHGGMEISGAPISEIAKVEGQDLYRQCFEHYCLEFDPRVSGDLSIRLAAVGMQYLEQFGDASRAVQRFVYSPETVLLEVDETRPQIGLDEAQEFVMVVLQKADQRAIAGVGARLRLFLPDGQVADFNLPPTGSEGKSFLTIPPQPSIPNGTVVQYQVCLTVESERPVCGTETYLVWDSD